MTTVPANSIAALPSAPTTPRSQPATPNSSFSECRQTMEKLEDAFLNLPPIGSLFPIQHAYYQ